MNNFLARAIEGTLASNVPALYFLGDMSKPVQIRVSLKDNNKDLPTEPSWSDFYIRTSDDPEKMLDDNKLCMFYVLESQLSTELSSHIASYHLSGIGTSEMPLDGLCRDISDVQTPVFYSHQYCTSLRGFDYVVSWKYDASTQRWARKWKSGYLEQGGFADNNGTKLIDVAFIEEYNYKTYSTGQSIYYSGYSSAKIGSDVIALS